MRPRPAHGPKGEETRVSEHYALREKTEDGRGKMENDNYNTGGTGANLFAGKSADAANGQVLNLKVYYICLLLIGINITYLHPTEM